MFHLVWLCAALLPFAAGKDLTTPELLSPTKGFLADLSPLPAPQTSTEERLQVLERAVETLTEQLDQVAQDALTTDLELKHVPRHPGENTTQTLVSLAASWGVSLDPRDVVFAEWDGRLLVARLTTRHLRDRLLVAAADVYASKPGDKRAIRGTERMTERRRRLVRATRKAAALHGWQYAGILRGRVYVKKTAATDTVWIQREEDLRNVFAGEAPLALEMTDNSL